MKVLSNWIDLFLLGIIVSVETRVACRKYKASSLVSLASVFVDIIFVYRNIKVTLELRGLG